MNYIKKLQRDNAKLQEAVGWYVKGLCDVRDYCRSDKFLVNNMVNSNDIIMRIHEILYPIDRVIGAECTE